MNDNPALRLAILRSGAVPNCPECGRPMILRDNGPYKTRSGQPKLWYACPFYPRYCTGSHGAHPDGTPLGTPANAELKALRTQAHKECGRVWGDWATNTSKQRRAMYAWLKQNTVHGHISHMDKEEVEELIAAVKELPPCE